MYFKALEQEKNSNKRDFWLIKFRLSCTCNSENVELFKQQESFEKRMKQKIHIKIHYSWNDSTIQIYLF